MSFLDFWRIPKRLKRMSDQLDTLTAQVTQNNTVIQSAITLIQGIKAQLDAAIASNDPQKLLDLSSSLAASDQSLADAVAANTLATTTDPAPTPDQTPPSA